MKFIDFADLLDTEPAHLAALSTFQFDPDFFERQLLRCPALVKARRILVFMDSSQWYKLLRHDVPARFLNRRYLVVPVRPPKGVFHPKLNLFLREDGGQVVCGSNNLTRSGCTSNLELLNALTITLGHSGEGIAQVAQDAYAFFRRACDDADQETGRIARQWLEEIGGELSWLFKQLPSNESRSMRLLDTYGGSLWEPISNLLGKRGPHRLLVISPFFDQKAELTHRFRKRWPKCQIEFVVQQGTTNLPVAPLRKLGKGITLTELRHSSRRLHAKLLAWESDHGTGCLVGSANFTLAAFDARNVEACLLLTDAEEFVSGLFDRQLAKRPLAFDDFSPGSEQEPEAGSDDELALRLDSAVLTEAGELRVSYRHSLAQKPSSLRLSIRIPSEPRPRALLVVPNKDSVTTTVTPPESALKDIPGTVLASLVASIGDERVESLPVWIIQEVRLTHDPNGEGASSASGMVEDSGEGLNEVLEKLGKQEGISAVIDFLNRRNIRFNDGETKAHGGRAFRIRIRDPFHEDIAPRWVRNAKNETKDLAEAVYAFADRHEQKLLRKHASRGNVNGMANFLNVFIALVRLLYVYHKRNVVHRLKLIGKIPKYIEIAIHGFDSENDYCEGFLRSINDNLGDSGYLQEECNELNFLGHVRAALVIVQRVRCELDETDTEGIQPKRPSEHLPGHRKRLRAAIKELGLEEPSKENILSALGDYKMFSPQELAAIEKDIFI